MYVILEQGAQSSCIRRPLAYHGPQDGHVHYNLHGAMQASLAGHGGQDIYFISQHLH